MSAYELIEEIRKSGGKVKRGVNEVTKAVERGVAKIVFYAKDTNPKEIVQHLPLLCKEKNVVCIEVDSKEKLGIASGLNVGASSVVVVDYGNAQKIVEEFLKNIK
jgi:large subunit ribosomal protein L7Ae